MFEPSRNEPCPCGSQKRYKHCHGTAEYLAQIQRGAEYAQLRAQLHWQQEKERQRYQGLGRPIISVEMDDGTRAVAVGNRLHRGNWKTFADFLMHYISTLFTGAWGNAELAKPADERHPLLNLYQAVCAAQHLASAGLPSGHVFETPITGAVSLYMGLAYDLYCVAHNAKTQPVWDRLMHRLREASSFHQAAYELLAAGIFARAGFALEFEDDTDSTRKHVEFIATHPGTSARFAVECKRRGLKRENDKLRVVSHLNQAIGQNETGLPLIVFVEMDRPLQYLKKETMPVHLLEAIQRLSEWEADPRSHQYGPAYVILTNQPQAHFPDEPVGFVGYLHGFKIPELAYRETGPLEDLVRGQELHPEVHDLHHSMRKHTRFPTSFDGNDPYEGRAELETPLDTYNFVHQAHKDLPRETLLDNMRAWPDYETLRGLSHSELLRRYAIAAAINLLAHTGQLPKQPG